MDDFPLLDFAEALEAAFDIHTLRSVVTIATGKQLESLTTANNLFNMALEIVTQARSGGWWPKLLDAAVRIARNMNGGGPINHKLAAIVAWQQAHTPPPTVESDPFRARYFSGIPFVSRRDLRANLAALAEGKVGAVFVDGAQKSGKSYSWHLIAWLRQTKLRDSHMFVVDLANWPIEMRNARDIAEGILLDLGSDESVPPPAVARDIVRLGLKLGQHIGALNKPYWLIIDGAAQPGVEVDDLGRQLIAELISAAVNQKVLNLRVVLLGYRNPLLTFRVASEQIAPPTRADFVQLLGDIAALERLPAAAARIDALAQQIADRLLTADAAVGLSPLHAALTDALAELRKPEET